MRRHFSELTATYNEPKLYYSGWSGNGPYSIRLRLTSYRVASQTAKTEVITAIPQIYGNTAGYGVTSILEGANELAKIQIEGHMDTPTVQDSNPLRSSVLLESYPVSYADVISAAIEGRTGTGAGAAVHPDYFLDPFGRKFTAPRIVAFNAQHVQGVPYRQPFSMTLQLTAGSYS